MAEIDIEKLHVDASRVIQEVEAGNLYVVTRGGRAAAAIVPIEDAEDLGLADADELFGMRRRARDDHRHGRTTGLSGLP